MKFGMGIMPLECSLDLCFPANGAEPTLWGVTPKSDGVGCLGWASVVC
jgi:hypothetical protein